MSSNLQLKKMIRLKCFDALELRGFKRFRKECVDWLIHDGFLCWIGLNTAVYPDRVEIIPFVGLHVIPIEKLFALKVGKYPVKYDRSIATYSVNLGSLEAITPGERAFAFNSQQSQNFIESECKRLAELYFTVGLSYACSIANYEALLPLLQENIETLGGYPERFAACLYLLEKKQEAYEFTKNFLIRQPDYFEGFANPFLEKITKEIRAVRP
ncbi:hypothetical protein [Methylomonas rhizoryzae]|uniref:hypothetical protein n=1 Tax=Methylomonas rhizoryzae TaxID=2608981 RepID=UPI00123265EB|nr:hypothetical protein [Methylomonas rhizoryzae]